MGVRRRLKGVGGGEEVKHRRRVLAQERCRGPTHQDEKIRGGREIKRRGKRELGRTGLHNILFKSTLNKNIVDKKTINVGVIESLCVSV